MAPSLPRLEICIGPFFVLSPVFLADSRLRSDIYRKLEFILIFQNLIRRIFRSILRWRDWPQVWLLVI